MAYKLSEFLGTFMRGLAEGRALADNSSNQVAQRYLEHDLMRGYPVPRMTIKTVELDFCFRIAGQDAFSDLIGQEEVQKAIAYSLCKELEGLFSDDQLKSDLGETDASHQAIENLLDSASDRIEQAITDASATRKQLERVLLLTLKNMFFELHMQANHPGLIKTIFQHLKSIGHTHSTEQKPNHQDDLDTWLQKQIDGVLGKIIPKDVDDGEAGELLVYVGGSSFEHSDDEKLQRSSIKFESSDRKWVATEVDGKKTYILDR